MKTNPSFKLWYETRVPSRDRRGLIEREPLTRTAAQAFIYVYHLVRALDVCMGSIVRIHSRIELSHVLVNFMINKRPVGL